MMSEADMTVVSATVVTNNPEHITRAAEVLGRASAGLVLDGIDVMLTFGKPEDDPEDGMQ